MDITIQIFGTLKCKESAKALRFFKERSIKPHFVDLNEKAISAGELDNILRNTTLDKLIDTESKEYKKLNLSYIIHDTREKLLEFPLLFKTPIVRYGKKATVGYEPDIWKKWILEAASNKK